MEDPDMEKLFSEVMQEISSRAQHLANLKQTLDAFQQKPDLFDEKDVQVLQNVMKRRSEEYAKLNSDYTTAKELYIATVSDLEKRIYKKDEILKQTDAHFGSISGEDELRLHFAQKQAQLQQGLQSAKAQLCSKILDRLRPTAPL